MVDEWTAGREVRLVDLDAVVAGREAIKAVVAVRVGRGGERGARDRIVDRGACGVQEPNEDARDGCLSGVEPAVVIRVEPYAVAE